MKIKFVVMKREIYMNEVVMEKWKKGGKKIPICKLREAKIQTMNNK